MVYDFKAPDSKRQVLIERSCVRVLGEQYGPGGETMGVPNSVYRGAAEDNPEAAENKAIVAGGGTAPSAAARSSALHWCSRHLHIHVSGLS